MKTQTNVEASRISPRGKSFAVSFYGQIYSIRYRNSYKIAGESEDYMRLYDKISLFAVEDVCDMVGIDEADVKRVCPLKYITRHWFNDILAAIDVTPRIAAGFNILANVEV